ncbi:MAG: tRNA (uridine(34)/cytosine(34)/5-carboxymethylaminomethyluridine(34)-2'-O)-methyltransferase TrmL, partial [Planctomycetota bacterium]|nr:tRNA (uridine(34)/cytosine(34)/5-carboxymethylaminomethyluridine(34)-2'-O)-methyltransferase TrmL [Planctomycetota bacterium]
MPQPRFHIVLLNPQIPNNTGNIGRTAAATGCRLHIVHPLGFDMSEKARRRAGLDYWHLVDCCEHQSWEAF